MNCEKHVLLIDDLIEGELDEQTAEQVSLHIFTCPDCTSRLEILEREKKIYSHYLFEVEPPNDLLARFQIILEAEKPPAILAVNGNFIIRLTSFLRFNPAFTTAVILILLVVGFGVLSSVKEEQSLEKASIQQNIQLILPKIIDKEKENAPVEPKQPEEPHKNDKVRDGNNPQTIAVKQTAAKKLEAKPKNSPGVIKLSDEEQAQIKLVQNLESETAKQLEKVELLLRSFRNARLVEGSEVFDISYEKKQARKLLQNNVELRQRAENYGTLFTEEMLSRVEPYLLDIANLDLNATTEKVLEIKERVRNQNIIASLQGF